MSVSQRRGCVHQSMELKAHSCFSHLFDDERSLLDYKDSFDFIEGEC